VYVIGRVPSVLHTRITERPSIMSVFGNFARDGAAKSEKIDQ